MARERGYSDVESGRTDRRVRTDNKGVVMENYVKMLRAPGAEWIQEAWVPKVGDRTDKGFVVSKVYTETGNLRFLSVKDYHEPKNNYYILDLLYLPSIEDYLGMVDKKDYAICQAVFELSDFIRDRFVYCSERFKTWPELIFTFVQHKVKRLSWDGEGWR